MSRSLANTIKAENLPVTSREQIHAWLEGEHTQVLHLDNLVNKLQPIEVGYILQEVEARGIKVQLAYVQGAISLQGANFDRLCRFLATPSLWTVNMGELMFSGPQLKNLKGVLENSNVTHMLRLGHLTNRAKLVRRIVCQEMPKRQRIAFEIAPVSWNNNVFAINMFFIICVLDSWGTCENITSAH